MATTSDPRVSRDFDPRAAALRYAGDVDRHSHQGARDAAMANALVCGLVYVGDQIAEQARLDREIFESANHREEREG